MRNFGAGVIGILVAIGLIWIIEIASHEVYPPPADLVRILALVDDDGGIVAQLVAAHHLDVELYGSLAHEGFFTFILVESLGTGLDKHIEGPSAGFVLQTLLPNQCKCVCRL